MSLNPVQGFIDELYKYILNNSVFLSSSKLLTFSVCLIFVWFVCKVTKNKSHQQQQQQQHNKRQHQHHINNQPKQQQKKLPPDPARMQPTAALPAQNAGAADMELPAVQSMDWLFKKERIYLLAQFWQQVRLTDDCFNCPTDDWQRSIS